MQNRLIYLVQFILAQAWQFMKLPFPGTDIPVGALLVMPTIVGFAVRFIKNITGVGGLGDIPSIAKSQFNNDWLKFRDQATMDKESYYRKW